VVVVDCVATEEVMGVVVFFVGAIMIIVAFNNSAGTFSIGFDVAFVSCNFVGTGSDGFVGTALFVIVLVYCFSLAVAIVVSVACSLTVLHGPSWALEVDMIRSIHINDMAMGESMLKES